MKPVCPKCGRKSIVHYIRSGTHWIPIGFWCSRCEIPVSPATVEPSRVFRMRVEDFLNTTTEKFDLIMVDPPWTYNTEAVRKGDRISSHYSQMSTEDICALPISNITEKNAVLFLWRTAPMSPDAQKVIESWGFNPKTQTELIWDKKKIGLGQNVRGQHEALIMVKKGNFPTPKHYKPGSVFTESRTDHSRKPVTSYDIVNRMYPEARKIELFARWVYPGWTGVGNEAELKPNSETSTIIEKKRLQNFEVEVI